MAAIDHLQPSQFAYRPGPSPAPTHGANCTSGNPEGKSCPTCLAGYKAASEKFWKDYDAEEAKRH